MKSVSTVLVSTSHWVEMNELSVITQLYCFWGSFANNGALVMAHGAQGQCLAPSTDISFSIVPVMCSLPGSLIISPLIVQSEVVPFS